MLSIRTGRPVTARIDTSALLGTIQVRHPQYETVLRALEALTARGRDLYIVPQNLVELWVVATRPAERNGLGMSPAAVAAELARIKSAVSFGADYKTYRLTSYATNLFRFVSTIPPDVPGGDPTIVESTVPSPQPTREKSLEYLPLALRWDGSRTDPRGTTTAGLGVNANFNFPGMSARPSFTNVTASAQGDGRYVTVVASLGRVERIYGDWTVSLQADGQWANQPLISNEQFGIGGIAGVRGYHEGEVYGDMGWRVVCEPRTPTWTLGLVNGNTPMRMRGAVFVDYGEAYLLDPQGRTSPTQLWGVGAGINVFVGELMDLRAAVGVPLLDQC